MSRFRYLRQARKLTLHLESPPLQRNMLAARNEAQPFKWRHYPMTWIKTLWMDDDERVKKAIEEERKLYPPEYATPVPAVFNGFAQSIVGSHMLIPGALYQPFRTFAARMSRALAPSRRP